MLDEPKALHDFGQTHCTLWMNDCSFTRRVLNICWSGCMVGATRNCCRLGASSVYTMQTIHVHTSLQWLICSKPHSQDACVFSCNLHFCHNDRNLLCARYRHYTDTEIRASTTTTTTTTNKKITPWKWWADGEESFPTSPTETWTWDLLIVSPWLCQWAIPAPQLFLLPVSVSLILHDF